MIPFIGLASDVGGRVIGSNRGPLLIQQEFSKADWKAMIQSNQHISDKMDHIALLNRKLALETFKCAKDHPFMVVIGGDHSCAIGTWSGVAEAQRIAGEDIALLWFDAHMDSHTPETSETGNIHGMPLASLLGYGSQKLTHILSSHPKIRPENLFLIGIRSYEEAEMELLKSLSVKIYFVDEVHERGLKAIIEEILEVLTERKLKYGISLDIDFFDPSKITATGTPVENGIDPKEFIKHYSLFKKYPPIAFEFVEFNPSLDNDNDLQIIKQILQKVTKQQEC